MRHAGRTRTKDGGAPSFLFKVRPCLRSPETASKEDQNGEKFQTADNHQETVVRLCREVPNIVGVKDATGNISQVAQLMSMTGEDVDLYSGNDEIGRASCRERVSTLV